MLFSQKANQVIIIYPEEYIYNQIKIYQKEEEDFNVINHV